MSDADALTPAQQARIDAARAYVNTTEDDDAYQRFVDPAGTKSDEARVAHAVSACMLLAAAILGWAGSFAANTIQVTLLELWVAHGFRTYAADVDVGICEGAQVWWAASAFAEEHVDACVERVDRRALEHLTLYVIAAGQRVTQADVDDGAFRQDQLGKRCVKRLMREVTWAGSSWVDDANKRHVRRVLDA